MIKGSAPTPPSACVHESIRLQAAITPEATAIEQGAQTITYAKLEALASRVACFLVGMGLKQGDRVLLCVPASIHTLVALLGILKAGGVYVPVDPFYPATRRELICSLASAKLLIVNADTANGVHGIPTLRIEAVIAAAAELPTSAFLPSNSLDTLSYIIFTSGSTGTPKGVPIHHRGVANLVQAMSDAWPIDSSSRVLQFASLGFDASVPEWACPLTRGGTVVLKPTAGLLLGEDLAQFLQERQITFLKLPASALQVMPQVKLPDLKTLVTAGEAVSLDLVSFWARGRRFFNCYGPTETSIGATMAQLHADVEEVTIGRPNPGMTAAVLNSNLEPMPAGSAGELYIGGVGLSWGYLNDPKKTAESFIPNPFGPPGSRLYKTGDLVRCLPSGELQFVGRLDGQVKVRGNRVELGEIEAMLCRQEVVAQALARFANDVLVAYVVLRKPSASAVPDLLRAILRKSLPDYMIPGHIMVLPEFPLSIHGKIDTARLPQPGSVSRPADPSRTLTTFTEGLLCEIWVAILGVEYIGADENFFDLGGHSLAATRAVSRINAHFGTSFQTQVLFENPSLRQLASELERTAGPNIGERIGTI